MMELVTLGDGPADAPVPLPSNSPGTDHTMWAPQIGGLTRHFRVLRYDQRCHAASDALSGPMRWIGCGAMWSSWLERVHVCGLSLGGMTGQYLAHRAPERIGKLILANTSAYMGPPSGWQARIEGALAQGMADAWLVVLRSAAHLSNVEQPDAFLQAMLDFLL